MFSTRLCCKIFGSPDAVSRDLSLAPAGAGPEGSEVGLNPSEKVSEAVRRFQSGHDREQSFQLLFQSFFPAIERFFARKGLPPEDCSDLAQETFLEIYRCLDDYRGEARFKTWLYRIATTTYLKSARAKSTAKRSGHEIPHDDAPAGEGALETPATQLKAVLKDERREAMRQAVDGLPEQMRKCLTLRLYHRLKYREIAEVMRLKIDTVKVHLFKGRKKLAKELQAYSLDDLSL
jgi:RNA polymerase sigma-70 factor (ECF subfamily)